MLRITMNVLRIKGLFKYRIKYQVVKTAGDMVHNTHRMILIFFFLASSGRQLTNVHLTVQF